MEEAVAAARSEMALLRRGEACQAEQLRASLQAQLDACESGARRILVVLLVEHSAKAAARTTVAEQLLAALEQQRQAAVAAQ